MLKPLNWAAAHNPKSMTRNASNGFSKRSNSVKNLNEKYISPAINRVVSRSRKSRSKSPLIVATEATMNQPMGALLNEQEILDALGPNPITQGEFSCAKTQKLPR